MVKRKNILTAKHKTFLDKYVSKFGYLFIIDAIEEHFKISKPKAIKIYNAYNEKFPNLEAQQKLMAMACEVTSKFKNVLDEIILDKGE